MPHPMMAAIIKDQFLTQLHEVIEVSRTGRKENHKIVGPYGEEKNQRNRKYASVTT